MVTCHSQKRGSGAFISRECTHDNLVKISSVLNIASYSQPGRISRFKPYHEEIYQVRETQNVLVTDALTAPLLSLFLIVNEMLNVFKIHKN